MIGVSYDITKTVKIDLMYRIFDGGRMYTEPGMSWTNYTGNYVTRGVGKETGHYRADEVVIGLSKEF